MCSGRNQAERIRETKIKNKRQPSILKLVIIFLKDSSEFLDVIIRCIIKQKIGIGIKISNNNKNTPIWVSVVWIL